MSITFLYCLTAGSAITDILKNKIFNTWLIFGSLTGLVLNLANGNKNESVKELMIKAMITLAILLPVYMIKGIGGGDLKLFMVMSLFLPIGEHIGCIIMAFIIGALMGIIKIIAKRNIHQTIHFALPMFVSILLLTGNNALNCM
ncbi:prepilin peptidase [Butyrivibrio sp. JL13D10]|uniref:prepilin peptidase n=1 Tax=Butyrivibrio sp. JL13D10 TaxID=3236815 RepID=UPI0038B436C4